MIQNLAISIDNQLWQIQKCDIESNRVILKSLANAILFCGRQGIGIHGHKDDSTADSDSNRGNFLALLEYSIGSGNEVLATHLRECMVLIQAKQHKMN